MLIKVEAVNIYGFVNDAQNLSAIRGAGLMLLEMPKEFGKWLRKEYGEVKTLTEGASKAVFRVTPKDSAVTMKQVETAARDWLRLNDAHATIAIATLETESGFFKDDEALTAAIRGRQMRSFSLAGLTKVSGGKVCALDHVRPGTEPIYAKDKPLLVSEASKARFEHGRDAKQSFFREHGDAPADWLYTNDMEELASWESAGGLDRKVAVFYADGNQLTKQLRDTIGSAQPARQERVIGEFDRHLQGKREEFLKALLKLTGNPEWKAPGDLRRIEVLLWGGDELMLVVPAWRGWATAELFCQTMKGADFVSSDRGTKILVKHGMGLVFAHHKAPIHALTSLARELAEESKEAGRKQDRLSYLALESFDHVGEDLAGFRKSRCAKSVVLNAEAAALSEMGKALRSLRDEEFPRRKVYQAAIGLAQGKSWDALKKDIEPFVKQKRWEQPLAAWKKLTGEEEASWYHLAELWDYVGQEL